MRNALARKDTTPERLLGLALAPTSWTSERAGQVRRTGKPVKGQATVTDRGFVLEQASSDKGLLCVRLDTEDPKHQERGWVGPRIECFHAGRLHSVRELPTLGTPTTKALRAGRG